MLNGWHALSALRYRRRPTRVVMVGKVAVGGDNPMRVQTMTTTSTMDTKATVEQVLRCAAAGAEIVRITAPSVRDARNLGDIKRELLARGCDVPLVADIHFAPEAAMEAALHVEKVRINPGNYADSKTFRTREFSAAEYAGELRRLEDKFTPLVMRCKDLGRSMRIGTNHGSLSDRIMTRFGDTPRGMVESAMEYLRVAEKLGYRDIILSMKASNPKVMVQAYRLLALRLDEEGMDHPFHLGVTEAGEGEDGRIKSALGIGALLEDGLGDTLRVSLTEDPEREVPVAFALGGRYPAWPAACQAFAAPGFGDEDRAWRDSHPCVGYARADLGWAKAGPLLVGQGAPVRVICPAPHSAARAEDNLAWLAGWPAAHPNTAARPEWIALDVADADGLEGANRFAAACGTALAMARFGERHAAALAREARTPAVALLFSHGPVSAQTLEDFRGLAPGLRQRGQAVLLEFAAGPAAMVLGGIEPVLDAADAMGLESVVVCLKGQRPTELIQLARALHGRLAARRRPRPLALAYEGGETGEEASLSAATCLGSLLVDGLGDAVWAPGVGGADSATLGFNILQAAGVRVTRTEFISCPGCGRTLFDLQEVTARIKARTGHLSGVKIAIMGCIVNGPGEMADADFGYVGGVPGHINLFVGKECLRKGIPFDQAEDALVQLIKDHGRWTEPRQGG